MIDKQNQGGLVMDFQTWIEGINGLASLYAFDILPDGTNSEIRLMAVNRPPRQMIVSQQKI